MGWLTALLLLLLLMAQLANTHTGHLLRTRHSAQPSVLIFSLNSLIKDTLVSSSPLCR